MDKPAKPDDESINEAGDKGRDEGPAGEVEAVHVGPPELPAIDRDVEPGSEILAKLNAAIAGLPKAKDGPDMSGLGALAPFHDEPRMVLQPRQSEVKAAPVEDVPPPIPSRSAVDFDGVDYDRPVHLRDFLGFHAFHSGSFDMAPKEPGEEPQSPQEAEERLSTCLRALSMVRARMDAEPIDVSLGKFALNSECRIRDALKDAQTFPA